MKLIWSNPIQSQLAVVAAAGNTVTVALFIALYHSIDLLICFDPKPKAVFPIKDKRLKQAKSGHFSIYSIRNWAILCLNHPYDWNVAFDCTNLSSNSLKIRKRVSVEIYCLVKQEIIIINYLFLLYIIIPLLYLFNGNTNWMRITTIISATTEVNINETKNHHHGGFFSNRYLVSTQ